MEKILIIFGTRPEAIKLAPIIKELKLRGKNFNTKVCVTAQHREMLDQILELFEIKPDYDLDVMKKNQDLSNLSSDILLSIKKIIDIEKPDWIIVQGDTTTTFISSLSAFYLKTKIIHIEAGLRTNNKYSPFPEEINRRLTSHLADIHFTSTNEAKNNLICEGINKNSIYVTGNTVIDALKWVSKKLEDKVYKNKITNYFQYKYDINLNNSKKTILVTGHRRESFGDGFNNICEALSLIAKNNPEIQIIYPVHLNPNVQHPVYRQLNNIENIYLIEPIDYEPFVFLMKSSYLILTDSGGIQEEAPSLGKPVLVMRDTTERPEGVIAGTSILVGTQVDKIVTYTERLLKDTSFYNSMSKTINPYGEGKSSEMIVNVMIELYNHKIIESS
jgi:UDP-N-acetylglucosamine 2-epimerase (non-hydrolysing)